MKTGLSLIVLLLMLWLTPVVASGQETNSPPLDLDDLKAFAEAWARIKSSYVEPIDDRRLLEAAIRGMVSELDQHSAWLEPSRFRRLEEEALGRYGGLGLRIAIQADHLQIVDIRPNTPAELAGLAPGDRITEIDGIRLAADSSERLALLLRGPVGSRVELALIKADSSALERVELTREVIRQTSVIWQILPDQQGLIRISSFQQTTPSELDRALAQLQEPQPPKGVIVDLRDNPGGMVQAAIVVADRFLEDGLIVQSEGRQADSDQRSLANPGSVFTNVPIAILINRQTASAAEILTAALRDQERAIVIGERSYGKGSVQSIWPLSNGSALRLTTARYRTPAGRNLEDAGIVPDIAVPYLPDEDPAIDRALEQARRWLEEQAL